PRLSANPTDYRSALAEYALCRDRAGIIAADDPRARPGIDQPIARRAAWGAVAGDAELFVDLAAIDRARRRDDRHFCHRLYRLSAPGDPGVKLRLGLLFWALFAGAASAQDPGRFDGQYMGEMVLTREIKGDCSTPPLGALYPLSISRGEVRFAYVPRF